MTKIDTQDVQGFLALNIASRLLLLVTVLSITACQNREFQREEVVDLQQRLDKVSVEVRSLRTVFCESRCETLYESCYLRVAIDIDVPGSGPERGPGPELPGCWPYDCESDEERERAEENPPLSCSELEAECKARC
ncbi:MAG: hypothetical protein IIA07_13220 [Proteobacteria bacterium]|nr:hypothetical protein [Pseudomonadota bacterium]